MGTIEDAAKKHDLKPILDAMKNKEEPQKNEEKTSD